MNPLVFIGLIDRPGLNVWPERPESGLDHEALPTLGALDPLYCPARPPHPLPMPSEQVLAAAPYILLALMFFALPLFMFFDPRKAYEDALAEALNQPEPPRPELSWETLTKLIQEMP